MKQIIPDTMKMVQTSWATIDQIFRDTNIIFAVELMILKVFNPVFFEGIVEVINGWYK